MTSLLKKQPFGNHRPCTSRRRSLMAESLEARHLLAGDVVELQDDEFNVQQESDWVTLDVLANDRIPVEYLGDGQITAASDGSNGGFVRISEDRLSLEYRPSVGITGTETLSYIVDGQFFAKATVLIASPLEKDEYQILQAVGETQLDLLANDPFFADYQGAGLISHVSATFSGATVRIAEDSRSVFYTAPDTFSGYDRFRYLVDGQFESNVTVTVERPVRDDSGIDVERNSTHNVIRPLDNDYVYWRLHDPPTTSFIVSEITSVSEPEHGTVTIGPDQQTLIYTPDADYVGNDFFFYMADETYQARVWLYVSRPVRGDGFQVFQLSAENVLDVRANDFKSDAYPGARLITGVTEASNGTVSISSNGHHLVYSPNEDFSGNDWFEYTIDDELTASVHVQVEPLAQRDRYEFGVNPAVSQYTLPLRNNDLFDFVDYDGPAEITAVTQPASGEVELLNGHSVRFTPEPGTTGYSSFEYTVDDRFTASVSVALIGYLRGDTLVVKQNSDGNVLNVLTNDDFDNQYREIGPYLGPRRITSVSETESGGIVTVGADARSVRYTPPENFVGTDRFQYTVDGVQSAPVYVNVTSYARDDRYRVDPDSEGKSLTVLVNDRSDHRTTRSVDRVEGTTEGGIVTVAADGQSIDYRPPAGFVGTDSFHYYLTDGSRAEVTVEVKTEIGELLPRFDDHADMGAFLITDAVERYAGLFGQRYYEFDRFGDIDAGADSGVAPEERAHSETNVQVAGVDEGDIIEVDSDNLYVLTEDSLLIVDAWPAEEITAASRTPIEGTPLVEYLADDRLTVISDTSVWISDEEVPPDDAEGGLVGDVGLVDGDFFWPYPYGTLESSVTVTVFDITDPTAPSVVETTKFDGAYQDSRAINGFVYLVLQDQFFLPAPEPICEEPDPDDGSSVCFYETEEQYLARVNENIGALIDESLPHFSSYGPGGEFVRGGLLAEAPEIFRPTFDDHGDLLVVTSVSMQDDDVGPIASAAIPMSAATQIYGSLENLYVFGADSFDQYDPATNVLKFAWNGETGGLDFAATGLIPGQLHGGNVFYGGYVGDIYIPAFNMGTGSGQFSIDEFEGHLRVATTTRGLETGEWNWRSSSDLYVLTDDGGVIEGTGSLQNMTPDQTIKSVRFLGDRAFVVTFNNSDPLLAIDLEDAADPVLEGQLLLPGFSSYLQPITANLVIGLGKNTPDGHSGPAQLSLYDISDLGDPVRLDEYTWDHWSQSEAALDHHAFGYFAYHSVVAIPVGSSRWVWTDTDEDGFLDQRVHHRSDDLHVFRYGEEGTITELGNVSHDFPVRRSGFIDDRLYSVSTDDVIVSDINDPSQEFGRLEFGARMFEPDPEEPPIIALAAASTPTPLDDGAVTGVLDATRAHLANELQTSVGQVSVVAVEGEVFYTACQDPSVGDVCATAATAGFEMVLDVAGTRYLYTGTSENDILLRETKFDFALARGASQNQDMANDANGDGVISPIDALLVINELGTEIKPLRLVDRDYENDLFADVNGDGVISPIDALSIINALTEAAASAQVALYRAQHPASADADLDVPSVGEVTDEALAEEMPSVKQPTKAMLGAVQRRHLKATIDVDESLEPHVVDALFDGWGLVS